MNVAVGHALCPDDAALLERHLRDDLPSIHSLTVTDMGAALGVHCGRGTLVVAIQPRIAPSEIGA